MDGLSIIFLRLSHDKEYDAMVMKAAEGLSNVFEDLQRRKNTDINCADVLRSTGSTDGAGVEFLLVDAAGFFLAEDFLQQDDPLPPASNESKSCWHDLDDCREGRIPRPLGSFKYADVSDRVYDNAAQVKNEAVLRAAYDKILFVDDVMIQMAAFPDHPVLEEKQNTNSEFLADSIEQLFHAHITDAKGCFDTLILDGDITTSLLVIDRKALDVCGGYNEALPAGEDYELLLRACDMGCAEGFCAYFCQPLARQVFQEHYFTYAYVLGKYAVKLRSAGMFDNAFSARYEEAVHSGIEAYFVENAERMIGMSDSFEQVDRLTRAVIVIYGEQFCRGIMGEFAQAFAQALRAKGQNVVLFNPSDMDETQLRRFAAGKYRAVVGFQTGIFAEQLENGDLWGNIFHCPKVNITFDNPLFISYYLMVPVKDYYVFSQDEKYCEYIRKYMKKVSGVWHFPPAGSVGAELPKKYGISFVGAYNNYRDRLDSIRNMKKPLRSIAQEMLQYLKLNPDAAADEALSYVAQGMTDRQFTVTLHKMMDVVRTVMYYYREKVVRTILDAGIELHVFSDTWRGSPLEKYSNLCIHDDVTYREGLDVMAESVISLNVMSWHKGGMTERVANSMLNRSVCLTDRTSYIERYFVNGQDLVTFDLNNLDRLPEIIHELLTHPKKAQTISQNGFDKANKGHTWMHRAELFIRILDLWESGAGEPELDILNASVKMEYGDFCGAFYDIHKGLETDHNNYELYYMRGLSYEQLGMAEESYYHYKLALYLCDRQTDDCSEDRAVIQEQFSKLCKTFSADAYKLGKACQALVEERLELGEYENTHAFLSEQLYDTNRVAAKIVLTEENMLLFMMLEIVLCEKKNMPDGKFEQENTCRRFQNDVRLFKKAYCELKFVIRRIWFGLSIQRQKELNEVLRQYPISPDMLAVVAKYSVGEEFWCDVYSRIYCILETVDPMAALHINRYRTWLLFQNIGNEKKCMEPSDYDNGAELIRLDAGVPKAAADSDGIRTADSGKIAVIMCTNDALYEKECVSYLKKLKIPDGKSLEIIAVYNASGMAAGYNFAMAHSNAKYKLYIHHDTFIIKDDVLIQLVKAFDGEYGSIQKGDADITVCSNKPQGRVPDMIGIFGSVKLLPSALWYQSSWEDSRLNLYQDAVLNILESVSTTTFGKLDDAEAIDGVFIATAADVKWREDLFDNWHYYDISQCYEFRKYGYNTAFVNDNEIWVLHETTMRKDPQDLYNKYRRIFMEAYKDTLPILS